MLYDCRLHQKAADIKIVMYYRNQETLLCIRRYAHIQAGYSGWKVMMQEVLMDQALLVL